MATPVTSSKIPHKTKLDLVLGPGNYRCLGRLTGLDRTYISQFMQGRINPLTGRVYPMSFENACLVADAAGVSLDTLRRYRNKLYRRTNPGPLRKTPWRRVTGWGQW